jgi:hypothetical protein
VGFVFADKEGLTLTQRYKPDTPPTACMPGVLESFLTPRADMADLILPINVTIKMIEI